MAGVHYELRCSIKGCDAKFSAWDHDTVGAGDTVHDLGWRCIRSHPQNIPDNYCPEHSKLKTMGPVFGALTPLGRERHLEHCVYLLNKRVKELTGKQEGKQWPSDSIPGLDLGYG